MPLVSSVKSELFPSPSPATKWYDTTGGNSSNQIAIASDTGAIYYDADGDYSNAVIIGSITASEVADLLAVNFTIV